MKVELTRFLNTLTVLFRAFRYLILDEAQALLRIRIETVVVVVPSSSFSVVVSSLVISSLIASSSVVVLIVVSSAFIVPIIVLSADERTLQKEGERFRQSEFANLALHHLWSEQKLTILAQDLSRFKLDKIHSI